ncbi:MAG: transketolase [Bacillus thermozeamaize]|uniref:Transketolase n=1 Tax=Bacillus thermozeamaize TaxID=230954 RepID=A0A1Y3PRB3_9BACI|nr:MAG: transketolase [Bacillus thermozeamaize]
MALAVREAFSQALTEAGKDPRIVVLDGDLASSTRVVLFQQKYPERFFQMGIMEQNMMGIAAGMAAVGLIPFVSTFAAFASCRVADQVRVSVAQPNLPVKIIGAYAGMFVGKNGKTHMAVEDIAIMRAIPHMTVLEPGDETEARLSLPAILDHPGPVYIRVAREGTDPIFGPDYRFRLGGSYLLRDGKDVAIISTGPTTAYALKAADLLAQRGISAAVLHLMSIKPIDAEGVAEAASKCGAVVTLENHNIYGGVGSAVAEVLGELCPVPMARVGIRDENGESASNEELARKYGFSPEHCAEAAERLLERKKGQRGVRMT